MDLQFPSWLSVAINPRSKQKDQLTGRIYYIGIKARRRIKSIFADLLNSWQLEQLNDGRRETYIYTLDGGPVWILLPHEDSQKGQLGLFKISPYARARNKVGQLVNYLNEYSCENFELHFHGATEDEKMGAFVGLEVGHYRFKRSGKKIDR